MLKNYFKIALRNITKYKAFSLLNISGLAIGITGTLLIAFYIDYERSYEIFHENHPDIFRVTIDQYNDGEFVINDAETYQTLGPEFKSQMPEVRNYVRLAHWGDEAITVEDRPFVEGNIYMADASVFDIFTLPMLHGEPNTAFNLPHKAVITESLAIKYFSNSDVVGRSLRFGTATEPLEIVGVMADLPTNTHLKINMLVSHPTLPIYWSWYEKYAWDGNNEYTYLLMEPNTIVESFNDKLKAYSENHPEIENEILISEKIADIHLLSNKSFEPEVNGSAQVVNFMLLVAVFIIILAWVNYINLSTSRAMNRAREVGVRKVVGSTRTQLIRQFLVESFLINLIACILAFTLVQLIMPSFSQLTGQELPLNLLQNQLLWMLMPGILITGTLLSGIYPAMLLSSFRPATVLKGKFSNSGSGLLIRKGLVVLQFVATVVLIAVSIAVYYQIDFMMNRDLGVDIDNKLVLRQRSFRSSDSLYISRRSAFLNDVRMAGSVRDVAQSMAVPGVEYHEVGSTTGVWRVEDDENEEGSYTYYIYDIDEHYLETLDIKLLAGRNFNENEGKGRILINAKAAEILGYESPEDAIGKKLRYGGIEPDEIIGVVDNFYQRSPKEKFIPLLLNHSSRGSNIIVKPIDDVRPSMLLAELESSWKKHFPEEAFDYFFLNDSYNHQYKTDQTFSTVTLLFTVLSLIIALLGLFGLSSFTIIQRKKEVGVRKVLGASFSSLIGLLVKDFLNLVLLAAVIAIPVAYLLIKLWLQNYAVQVSLSWWFFALPIVLIMVVALATVMVQTIKSVLTNPINSLRYE